MEAVPASRKLDVLLRQVQSAADDSSGRQQISVAVSQLASAVQELLSERTQLIEERNRLIAERDLMASRLTRGPLRPSMTTVNTPGLS